MPTTYYKYVWNNGNQEIEFGHDLAKARGFAAEAKATRGDVGKVWRLGYDQYGGLEEITDVTNSNYEDINHAV